MKLPPTVLIEDTDFRNSWARAIRYVLREGIKITIGDSIEPKKILDICATIELTGTAIKQIENRELHPQFPFQHIDQYCEEFTRDYLIEYIETPVSERFSYLYFHRLAVYRSCFDQIKFLRDRLGLQTNTDISSNRDQSITWDAEQDFNSASPPCLQRIWIRYLGDQNVEVHLTWRSRDGYGAFQANLIALIDMLNREIIHPNGCNIVKLVDYSDSWHIYESDISAARNVKLVPTSPMP